MAFNDKAENQGHDNDRLSLLPDTILIDILSRLPLQTAASTEVLSPYWRDLWTQMISIDINVLKLKPNCVVFSTFDCIMRRFTLSSIHTFNVARRSHNDHIWIDWWLKRICKKRSLRHFRHSVSCVFEAPIPPFIFQTHSLVSIDFDSPGGWRFPKNIDQIILPNLVTLSLSVAPLKHYDSLEKLIQSCPSLEKLSLKIARSVATLDVSYLISIKLFNVNLRWLYIAFRTQNNRLSINAPMLRYLAIRALEPPTFCFDEVPIGLHEAKIDFDHHAFTPVTIFRNVTRLTLTIASDSDCVTVLSQLVHFPKLNTLILKVWGQFYRVDGRISLDDAGVSALRQMKRIDIDTDWDFGYKYIMGGNEFFSRLVAHLLKSATVLEHFNFSRQTSSEVREGNAIFEESEYMFCCLLYDSPRASKECEVSFTGRCLLMSGKTIPNVLKANGEVLPLNTELIRKA